jgi:small lipoprotein (TIGR04452 family)
MVVGQYDLMKKLNRNYTDKTDCRINYILRTADVVIIVLISSFSVISCSAYNGLESNKLKYEKTYMQGSDAREWIRMNLFFPYIMDSMAARSSSNVNRDYYEQQALLDLIVADMIPIENSSWYLTKDVEQCVGQVPNVALFVDTRISPFVCNLDPVSSF